MRKDAQQISIVTAPINIPKEEIFGCAINDHNLSDYICKFRKDIEKQGVEVFARKGNVIATSNGYYTAMYTDDIRNMEGGIDNPTPFKGIDGRLKVRIIKENGDEVFDDLATIVAMAFCPNISKRKKVWFKDYQVENCNGQNLVWLNKFDYFMVTKFYKWFGIKLMKWK